MLLISELISAGSAAVALETSKAAATSEASRESSAGSGVAHMPAHTYVLLAAAVKTIVRSGGGSTGGV